MMKIEQIIDEMQASLTKLRGRLRDRGKAEYEELHRQVGNIITDFLRGTTSGEEARKLMREFFVEYPNTFFVAMPECHKCGKRFEWVAGGGSHNNDCSEYTCPDCNKLKTAGVKPLEPCHNYPYRINKAIIDSAGYPSPDILDEIAELRKELGECTCDPEYPDSKEQCDVHKPDFPLHARVAKALGKRTYQRRGRWYIYHDKEMTFYSYPKEPLPIPDYPNDLVAAMGALEEYCRKHGISSMIKACYLDEYHRPLESYYIEINNRGCWYVSGNLPQAICEAIVAHAEGE